ncbi:phage major capsid protein [Rhizobium sp. GN54]|uniref:phage major capsid protein n=1 Tax=Rhizobium sp. GN54 TaxID=2898150 RepID=UPI001E470F0E|nr:phage major capsid protein [Rhizobium sp. GN54]MCD2185229.1 phage major capsid protein [Rhizobium sp. GN54]
MTKHETIEVRSALPIETRNENTDPLAAATAAVAELERAAEQRHTAHQTEVRGLTERLAQLETRLSRPGTQTENKNEPNEEQRAFGVYLRRGERGMTADETRAMTAATDTAGGFLVPETFVAELLRNVVQFSPVRAYARVMSIAGADVTLPKRTGTMSAVWVGETADRTGTQPTYGDIKLTPYEAACFIDVSNQLLEDAALNISSELSFDAAEEFGRLEGAAFVSGDGVGKPKGILAETTIGTVITGHASTLGSAPADKMIDAFYALPAAYRANATWGMNSTTLATVRKLKDSQGNFLWQPGLVAGQPDTILGRPVAELPDMPDVAAASTPIVLGDFSQGYRIVDRVSLALLRDPYSLATKGQTRFHLRRRVGGGVVKAEAFKLIKVAAS